MECKVEEIVIDQQQAKIKHQRLNPCMKLNDTRSNSNDWNQQGTVKSMQNREKREKNILNFITIQAKGYISSFHLLRSRSKRSLKYSGRLNVFFVFLFLSLFSKVRFECEWLCFIHRYKEIMTFKWYCFAFSFSTIRNSTYVCLYNLAFYSSPSRNDFFLLVSVVSFVW